MNTLQKGSWKRVFLYLFVFVVCIVILYPYFVMFTTAAKTNEEMYATTGTLLPKVWQWSNFVEIWTAAPVFRYLMNSVVVAGGATILAILCGIPAAYALSRMKFKGKGFFMGADVLSAVLNEGLLFLNMRSCTILQNTD